MPEKMEETFRYKTKPQLHHRPSRLGLVKTTGAGAGGGGGEIVEVQGGHIVRSTSRKDRHSKVCTAKGTRDRRVRLSAHTAIQFYDVQDRLGYDRPSKAVDWLIKKAKASIDELAELPAWKPAAVGLTPVVNLEQNPRNENLDYHRLRELEEHPDEDMVDNHMGQAQNSSFLSASLDSVKSFFPMPAGDNCSSAMQFHRNFPPAELISTTGGQNNGQNNQDLKLSLQTVQGNNIYFDGSGWPENSGFTGSVFNSQPAQTQTTPFLQPLFGKPTNSPLLSYISERGPLQSSNSPPVRAWVDPPPPFSGAGIDPNQTLVFHHPSSMPGFNNPGMGGFSGFHIPARIRGDEEEHDGFSDKPSSASSATQ